MTNHKIIETHKMKSMRLLMKCTRFRPSMAAYRCIKRKGVITLKIKEDPLVHRLNKIRILKNIISKVPLALRIFLKCNKNPMIKMLHLLLKRTLKELILSTKEHNSSRVINWSKKKILLKLLRQSPPAEITFLKN